MSVDEPQNGGLEYHFPMQVIPELESPCVQGGFEGLDCPRGPDFSTC